MIAVDCPICMGKGFALVWRKGYEYKMRCKCRHGEAHSYEGAECKHQSRYYCASVEDLPPDEINKLIADNCKRYGIRKVGDRWMRDTSERLTDADMAEFRKLMKGVIG